MPTERFYHLPEEKRLRITEAAMRELARVPYEKLSINQIIREADIPRGSFYQYFTNKDDLLQYLLQGLGAAMHDNLRAWLRQYNGDVFAVLEQMLAYLVEVGAREGYHDIFKNVFAHLRVGGESAPVILCLDARQLQQEYGPDADFSGLKLEGTQAVADFLEMLIALLRRALVRAFTDIGQAEAVKRSFANQMTMLKFGVAKTEGGN